MTAYEQAVQPRLARRTRVHLTVEAAWPSQEEPAGRVQLEADLLVGPRAHRCPREAFVVLRREPSSPHGFAVHTTAPCYL
ncbi:hypothetical protein [Streptomyces sp. NPDC005262]|uniref:hypothetical protein n=1 Tax=Streptomyces sp. NPDC005262 TaxID=3364710 RepID=UPI003685F1F3